MFRWLVKLKYHLALNQNKLWGWVGNHEQRLNRLEERVKHLEGDK